MGVSAKSVRTRSLDDKIDTVRTMDESAKSPSLPLTRMYHCLARNPSPVAVSSEEAMNAVIRKAASPAMSWPDESEGRKETPSLQTLL